MTWGHMRQGSSSARGRRSGHNAPFTRKLGCFALVALSLWLSLGVPVAGGWVLDSGAPAALSPPQPTAMPGSDRLAEPVLPESPTQVDIGRRLYYFHCMPCHGDRGQGLTDEWRQVWVEDHQNCWGRGCHTGKSDMEAFYLPHFVPPVSGSPSALRAFPTADALFDFLHETHPPQRPGALSETEYWELTAFLLHENDRLATGVQIGPEAAGDSTPGSYVILATLLPLLALFLVRWLGRRQSKPVSSKGNVKDELGA